MSRFVRALTVVGLVWCASSRFADAQLKSDDPLPTHKQLARLGLERAWWAQAILNPLRDKIRNIAVDEDLVYVQSTSGVTTAFDAETGRQIWATQLGRFDPPSYPAVSNEDTVLLVVGATMYALNKRSGQVIWTLVLPGQPSTGPAIDDLRVYFGTLDGSLYAYSLVKIRKLFEQRRLPEGSLEAQLWKYKAGKQITSPPITTARSVNFASQDGSLYSVTALDRKLIYLLETDKPIVAPLARLDNTMFMASEDNSFYAINLTNGKVHWEFTSGLPIRKAPIAIDHDLYVLPDRGGLYCLDPVTGEKRWWQSNLTYFNAMLRGSIAAFDVEGNLVTLSRERGEVIGSLPLRRFTIKTANERTDRIFLSTDSGLVICLRQIGSNFPMYHRFPDRLPLLPDLEADDAPEAPRSSESSDN